MDTFELASQVYIFHNIIAIVFAHCVWACLWFYIKPFRGFKAEKTINAVFLYAYLMPFLLFCIYGLYNEILFYLHPEKVDGYWQATINEDHIMSKVYQFHTMIAFNMMTAVLLLIPIIRDKKNILRLSLLFIFRILAPIFYFTTLTTVSEGKWTIPGIALIGVVDSFITTWFVSDYRLFNSSIKAANSDLLNSISDLAISTDKNLLMTNANDQVNSLLNVQQGNSIIAIMAKNLSLIHI